MAVFVAQRPDDRRVPALGHREKVMGLTRRTNRVQSNAQIAVSPVLEAHRT